MKFKIVTATKRIVNLKRKIRAVCGGTSASKTISILFYLIDLAQRDESPTLTSVVSESLPHLKRGARRDFKNIMVYHGYWDEKRWNATNSIYTFETGSEIEFFGADAPDKLRGARRDRLFINEANNIPLAAFDQLEVRTKEFVYLDWNPTNEFWFYDEILPNREDVDFITLTYLDNEALDQAIIDSIEARKGNVQWWKVYGLGQLGEMEGRIYTGWKLIDEIPHEAKLVRRGLDFGYSVDPTVIEDIYEYDGGFIIDEKVYQKGLSNRAIADLLLNMEHPNTLVVADSSEPKSIDEIRDYGVNIVGALKGQGSVNKGIQSVQDKQISITKRSTRTIKGYRNFLWATDRNGKAMNVPDDTIHEWSNPMDAIRYGLGDYMKKIVNHISGTKSKRRR